jgi:hypothetical protein
MQELELTWSQVIRIWWAIFWRWLILNQITGGIMGALIGIPLMIIGHREWVQPDWWISILLVTYIPSAAIAIRLAIKAKYSGFRVAIIAGSGR